MSDAVPERAWTQQLVLSQREGQEQVGRLTVYSDGEISLEVSYRPAGEIHAGILQSLTRLTINRAGDLAHALQEAIRHAERQGGN